MRGLERRAATPLQSSRLFGLTYKSVEDRRRKERQERERERESERETVAGVRFSCFLLFTRTRVPWFARKPASRRIFRKRFVSTSQPFLFYVPPYAKDNFAGRGPAEQGVPLSGTRRGSRSSFLRRSTGRANRFGGIEKDAATILCVSFTCLILIVATLNLCAYTPSSGCAWFV